MRSHHQTNPYAERVNTTYSNQESSVRFSLGGSLGPLNVSVPLGSTRGAGQATGGLIHLMLKLSYYLMIFPFILMYRAVKYSWGPITRFYQHPDLEVRRKRKLCTAVTLTVLFALSIPSSLFKLEIGSALLSAAVAVGCAYWAFREYRIPIIAANAATAARADEQNQAWLNGDPSGLYGTTPPAPDAYNFVDTRQV